MLGVLGSNEGQEFVFLREKAYGGHRRRRQGQHLNSDSCLEYCLWSARSNRDKKKGKIIIYSFPTSVAPGSNPDRLTGRGREDSQLTPHLATGLFNSDPKCA